MNQSIACDRRNAARIVSLFLTKGWPFRHHIDLRNGNHVLTFNAGIDLETDIRKYLRAIHFKLHEFSGAF